MSNKGFTTKSFIQKARLVHGDVYDYSEVEYKNCKTDVRIICALHGIFLQKPEKHLMGRGCPKCGVAKAKQTCVLKYGVAHPLQSLDIRQKIQDNNMEKYGVGNPAVLDTVKEKRRNTNLVRYGAANVMHNDDIKARHHTVMRYKYGGNSAFCDPAVVDKANRTRIRRYGAACPFSCDVIADKAKASCMLRYGTEYALQNPAVRKVAENTCFAKYGVSHPLKCPDIFRRTKDTLFVRRHVHNPMHDSLGVQHCVESKRRNGTFSTSSCEELAFQYLCVYFGESDVVRQYQSGVYPYCCDFYVKSLDAYVELNVHWTHGHHWFDAENADDLALVRRWENKCTKFYQNAVHVWCDSDVRKRRCAAIHDLNYAVFWRQDLQDFCDWLSDGCPARNDWL